MKIEIDYNDETCEGMLRFKFGDEYEWSEPHHIDTCHYTIQLAPGNDHERQVILFAQAATYKVRTL